MDTMESLALVSFVLTQRSIKTGALAGVTHIAVAQPPDFDEHGIVVAVHEDVDDRQLVARRLALHPERVPRPAEEGRVAGAACFRESDVVHEADHQDFAAIRILDDRRYEAV